MSRRLPESARVPWQPGGRQGKTRSAMRPPQCRVVTTARRRLLGSRDARNGPFATAGLFFERDRVSLVFAALQRRIASTNAQSGTEGGDAGPGLASAKCSYFVCRITRTLDWHLPRSHVRDQNAATHASGIPLWRRRGSCPPRDMCPGFEEGSWQAPAAAVDGSIGRTAGVRSRRSGPGRAGGASPGTRARRPGAASHGWPQDAAPGRKAGIVRGERHRGRA